MNTPAELNEAFAVPGVVRFESGEGGLTRIVLSTPAAEAHVYTHGAHVTHYQPAGAAPVLFLSGKSLFARDKPIRGGVPVIFPWFGPRAGDPAAPAHGFARTAEWSVREVKQAAGAVAVSLGLSSSEATRRYLPNDFELVYTVSVGDAALDLSLEVFNRSKDAFVFEEALHTYLEVGDVRQATIEGLEGVTYIDKTAAMSRKTQSGPIRISAETDRVYLDTTGTVTVNDPARRRTLAVGKSGSRTTVVWNPWVAKAEAMADFGDEEWPRMLCIETANAGENAVDLPAGQSHRMSTSLRLSADR